MSNEVDKIQEAWIVGKGLESLMDQLVRYDPDFAFEQACMGVAWMHEHYDLARLSERYKQCLNARMARLQKLVPFIK